jgi:hypothetical protein
MPSVDRVRLTFLSREPLGLRAIENSSMVRTATVRRNKSEARSGGD